MDHNWIVVLNLLRRDSNLNGMLFICICCFLHEKRRSEKRNESNRIFSSLSRSVFSTLIYLFFFQKSQSCLRWLTWSTDIRRVTKAANWSCSLPTESCLMSRGKSELLIAPCNLWRYISSNFFHRLKWIKREREGGRAVTMMIRTMMNPVDAAMSTAANMTRSRTLFSETSFWNRNNLSVSHLIDTSSPKSVF